MTFSEKNIVLEATIEELENYEGSGFDFQDAYEGVEKSDLIRIFPENDTWQVADEDGDFANCGYMEHNEPISLEELEKIAEKIGVELMEE